MTSALLAPRTGDAPVILGAASAVRLENVELGLARSIRRREARERVLVKKWA